jgi:hypothetical protein
MTSGVKMAPTFHFYKDGAKLKEYVGSSYPALEVRLPLLCITASADSRFLRAAHDGRRPRRPLSARLLPFPRKPTHLFSHRLDKLR